MKARVPQFSQFTKDDCYTSKVIVQLHTVERSAYSLVEIFQDKNVNGNVSNN